MRQEFIQVKSRQAALKAAPWACRLIKVTGGYMAFESNNDAYRWLSQK